jgi:TonB family protein
MEIRGRRAGLDFSYKAASADFAKSLKIRATPSSKTDIDILISRDAQHPETLDAAVDRVLSLGIDEKLAASAPYYWQWLLWQYVDPKRDSPQPDSADRIYHLGGGVTNPILRYAPDPAFSTAVRKLGVSGMAVIALVVDEDGLPRQVHIVRPLGMGADECAVAAVLQYRFSPATYHKRPMPAEINIEVNFRPR